MIYYLDLSQHATKLQKNTFQRTAVEAYIKKQVSQCIHKLSKCKKTQVQLDPRKNAETL